MGSGMDKFTIRATVVTPAIIGTLTLDGLLGAILFEELQDIDKAHEAIPIQCRDGLYRAGVAQFVGPVESGKHGFIAGLRATHDLDLDLIKQGKDGGPHRHICMTRQSDFGNVINGYMPIVAKGIEWHAEGDAEEVLELLQNVHGD